MSKSENIINPENEVIFEGELDGAISVYLSKSAIEENSKFYGPIYLRLVSEYALDFESRMLKEKPPENIQGLDAVTNYIIANLNRYPQGNCALQYAISKTESKLQGHAGSSGSRRAAFNSMKKLLETAGLLNSVAGTTVDIIEAAKGFKAKFDQGSAVGGLQLKKGEQVQRAHYIRVKGKNEAIIVYSNCPSKDNCRALMEEGISRMLGGLVCPNLILYSAVTEIITKKRFDYALDEFDKPDCKGRIFEV